MTVEEYLRQGRELKEKGHYTDGCSFVGWLVPDKYTPACWSHDYARNGFINLSHSENDNMFRSALRFLGMSKFWSNIMYYFTKTQGWFKEKFNMSGTAFAGFLLFLFLAILAFNLSADQRIDRDTNNCHASVDAEDDDNEIDLPCNTFNSEVNRYTDANGVRRANGFYYGLYQAPLDQGVNQPLMVEGANIYLKGKDSTATDKPYLVAANTACNLVRSNYQENTGSDDQNQTEYTSNDYELKLTWFNKFGNEHGHFGIWYAEMYCRNGAVN